MDYTIKRITNEEARQIIVNNHYSHSWTSCKYAIGLYKANLIVGVAVYGHPVGRNAALSVSPLVNEKEVLELTRLWISDSEGKNTESWFLGQTFRWLREYASDIKVLISYSDPNAGHVGIIYQATNWLYQGRNSDSKWYLINGELLHPRTVYSRFGTRAMEELNKMPVIKHVEIVEVERKYRYIYILTGKRERKRIIDSLYRKPISYEKTVHEGGFYEKSNGDNQTAAERFFDL